MKIHLYKPVNNPSYPPIDQAPDSLPSMLIDSSSDEDDVPYVIQEARSTFITNISSSKRQVYGSINAMGRAHLGGERVSCIMCGKEIINLQSGTMLNIGLARDMHNCDFVTACPTGNCADILLAVHKWRSLNQTN